MSKKHVSELVPGMIALEDIKSKSDQIIIAKGSELTRQNISRLKFYNFDVVDVDPPLHPVKEAPAEPIPAAPVEPAKPVEIPSLIEEPQEEFKIETIDIADIPVEIAPEQIEATAPKAPEPEPEPKPEPAPAPAPAEPKKKSILSANSNEDEALKRLRINYTTALLAMKGSFNAIANGGKIDEHKLLTQTAKAFEATESTRYLFDVLHTMRSSSDAVYTHSLNVALIAAMLGKWLKFSEEDIHVLSLCGMLHDIGKILLPPELLNKPGKYTDEEFAMMKRHPLMGFNRMKKEEIDPRIKKSALMHHERADGSGYPHGLAGDEIHPFARIIAIADVFDAMTSSRSYRSAVCPFEVIARFEDEGIQKYDTRFMLTFLQNIANNYKDCKVVLSDGRSGTVRMLNQSQLSRPVVEIDGGEFLDLSKEPGISIKAIF